MDKSGEIRSSRGKGGGRKYGSMQRSGGGGAFVSGNGSGGVLQRSDLGCDLRDLPSIEAGQAAIDEKPVNSDNVPRQVERTEQACHGTSALKTRMSVDASAKANLANQVNEHVRSLMGEKPQRAQFARQSSAAPRSTQQQNQQQNLYPQQQHHPQQQFSQMQHYSKLQQQQQQQQQPQQQPPQQPQQRLQQQQQQQQQHYEQQKHNWNQKFPVQQPTLQQHNKQQAQDFNDIDMAQDLSALRHCLNSQQHSVHRLLKIYAKLKATHVEQDPKFLPEATSLLWADLGISLCQFVSNMDLTSMNLVLEYHIGCLDPGQDLAIALDKNATMLVQKENGSRQHSYEINYEICKLVYNYAQLRRVEPTQSLRDALQHANHYSAMSMEPVSLANCLHGWATLSCQVGAPASSVLEQLMYRAEFLMRPDVNIELSADVVSKILWAFVTLQFQIKDSFLDSIKDRAFAMLSDFFPKDLSRFLWAYANTGQVMSRDHALGVETCIIGHIGVSNCMPADNMDDCPRLAPADLSKITWAYAMMGLITESSPELIKTLEDYSTSRLHLYEAAHVESTLSSYATAKARPSDSFLEGLYKRGLEVLSDAIGHEIVSMLWALAHLGDPKYPTPSLHSRFWEFANKLVTFADDVEWSFTPQNVADTLLACAKLGINPGEGLLAKMGERVVEAAPELSPEQLTNIMWGIAELGRGPNPALSHAIDSRALALLTGGGKGGFKAEEMGRLMWSFAALEYRPSDKLLVLMLDAANGPHARDIGLGNIYEFHSFLMVEHEATMFVHGSEIAGKFNLLLESLRRNGGAPRCIPRDDKDGEITKISKEMITRMPPEWDVRESYVMTKLKYPVDYTLDVIIMGESPIVILVERAKDSVYTLLNGFSTPRGGIQLKQRLLVNSKACRVYRARATIWNESVQGFGNKSPEQLLRECLSCAVSRT